MVSRDPDLAGDIRHSTRLMWWLETHQHYQLWLARGDVVCVAIGVLKRRGQKYRRLNFPAISAHFGPEKEDQQPALQEHLNNSAQHKIFMICFLSCVFIIENLCHKMCVYFYSFFVQKMYLEENFTEIEQRLFITGRVRLFVLGQTYSFLKDLEISQWEKSWSIFVIHHHKFTVSTQANFSGSRCVFCSSKARLHLGKLS